MVEPNSNRNYETDVEYNKMRRKDPETMRDSQERNDRISNRERI